MLSKQDLTNLKNLVGDVITEKLKVELGENYKDRFNRMENNIDRVVKIASDTRQEQVLTQAKVDKHDRQIKELQVFTGFAPSLP